MGLLSTCQWGMEAANAPSVCILRAQVQSVANNGDLKSAPSYCHYFQAKIYALDKMTCWHYGHWTTIEHILFMLINLNWNERGELQTSLTTYVSLHAGITWKWVNLQYFIFEGNKIQQNDHFHGNKYELVCEFPKRREAKHTYLRIGWRELEN